MSACDSALHCVLPASHGITGASSAVCRIRQCWLCSDPTPIVTRACAHRHRKFDRIMPGLFAACRFGPPTYDEARPSSSLIDSAGRRQDLPTGEAENGMLLHLATMAPRERFELDAGLEIAASDVFGRNRDGPNTCPANFQPVSRFFDVNLDQSSPLLCFLFFWLQTGSKLSASGDATSWYS